LVAISGFLVVASAYDYKIPGLGISADMGFWVNGGIGLSLIIVGIVIVVMKR
jgi:hypothetical protein